MRQTDEDMSAGKSKSEEEMREEEYPGAVDEAGYITWFVAPSLPLKGKLVSDGTPQRFLDALMENPHAKVLRVV